MVAICYFFIVTNANKKKLSTHLCHEVQVERRHRAAHPADEHTRMETLDILSASSQHDRAARQARRRPGSPEATEDT